MQETDRVNITRVDAHGYRVDDNTPVDELRQCLQIDPVGITRVRFHKKINLTALGAVSQIAIAVPAGAIIRYVSAYIDTTVVASSTTTCIGIGSSSAVSKYGFTSSLLAGQVIATLVADAISSGENIGVVANITGGGTIGAGNITAGVVNLTVVYDIAISPQS
jgi:hypothetical protein